LTEREKHKAYLRRKKRERTESRKKKFDIMDKARSGFYIDNPEYEHVKKDERNKRRAPGYEFIKHPR
jgi:hypothetical protein